MLTDIVKFYLRVPADIKAQLDANARKQKRSLNSEILVRLSESLEHDQKQIADFTIGQLVDELLSRNVPGEIEIRINGFDEK